MADAQSIKALSLTSGQVDRFLSFIEKSEGCWEWRGTRGRTYGVFRARPNPRNLYAHRVMYELSIGAIPADHIVLHSCGNDFCVRPDHLRLTTTDDPVFIVSPAERFWAKVDKTSHENGCWLWLGSKSRGYGKFFDGQRIVPAHRFAYGPVPAGLVIDHLCRNPPCVNPDHLEAVTQQENIRRGDSPAKTAARYRRGGA